MTKLLPRLKSSRGFSAVEVLVVITIFAVFGLGVWVWWNNQAQPVYSLNPETFEDGGQEVQEITRIFPNGKKAVYGSIGGPLTQPKLAELDAAVKNYSIEEGRFTDRASSSSQSNDSLINSAYAQSALENLPIEPTGSEYEKNLRAALQENKIYWTQEEMQRLRKIKVSGSMGRNLGMYNYARIYDKEDNFVDWIGIIYVKAYPGNEATLAHEYGHHFTNFWAARESNDGRWERYPKNEAGDYYILRPLPEDCHCGSYDCPYYQRDWEILAEDFRNTVTEFGGSHMFAGASCPANGGTLGFPQKESVEAYFKAMVFNLTSPTPAPTSTPTPTPEAIFEPLQGTPTSKP